MSYDGCCNKSITLKHNFTLGLVFPDYSMLIMSYKIGKVHFCLLDMNDFHLRAKNERFTAAGLHNFCCQNLKYENFTWFGQLHQKITAKSALHVQHDYFSLFNQLNC